MSWIAERTWANIPQLFLIPHRLTECPLTVCDMEMYAVYAKIAQEGNKKFRMWLIPECLRQRLMC
jgi:hypothetical protein